MSDLGFQKSEKLKLHKYQHPDTYSMSAPTEYLYFIYISLIIREDMKTVNVKYSDKHAEYKFIINKTCKTTKDYVNM